MTGSIHHQNSYKKKSSNESVYQQQLHDVCKEALTLFKCDFAGLYLYSSKQKKWVIPTICCKNPADENEHTLYSIYPNDSQVMQDVLSAIQPIVVLNLSKNSCYLKDPLLLDNSISFVAASPITLSNQEIIGSLVVFDTKPRKDCESLNMQHLVRLSGTILTLLGDLSSESAKPAITQVRELLMKACDTQRKVQNQTRKSLSPVTSPPRLVEKKSTSLVAKDDSTARIESALNRAREHTETITARVVDNVKEELSKQTAKFAEIYTKQTIEGTKETIVGEFMKQKEILLSRSQNQDQADEKIETPNITQEPWKTQQQLESVDSVEAAKQIVHQYLETVKSCNFRDQKSIKNSMLNAELVGRRALELCLSSEAINLFSHCIIFSEGCQLVSKEQKIRFNRYLGDGYYSLGNLEVGIKYYLTTVELAGYKLPTVKTSSLKQYKMIKSQYYAYQRAKERNSGEHMENAELFSMVAVAFNRLQDWFDQRKLSYIATFCCWAALECSVKANRLVRVLDTTPKTPDIGFLEKMYFRRVRVNPIGNLTHVMEELNSLGGLCI